MRYEFGSITDFFCALNQAEINYLVLRNYENLLNPEIYVGGHGDVDLLCDDSRAIVELTGAQPMRPDKPGMLGDGIHYSIMVGGNPVQLDLRQVGDGYYCSEWEKGLLERKVRRDCFYVMADEDYFYTLAYHAILQKRGLSEDYRSRLYSMAIQLGLEFEGPSEREFIRLLEDHMRVNGYRFTFSHDYMVPNRFHLVDKGLVEKDRALQWRHFAFDLKVSAIEWAVKLKHAFSR